MREILSKIFSGRWIMTVTCAVALLICTLNKTFTAEVIERIITVVIVFYFTKAQTGGVK